MSRACATAFAIGFCALFWGLIFVCFFTGMTPAELIGG